MKERSDVTLYNVHGACTDTTGRERLGRGGGRDEERQVREKKQVKPP